MSNPSDCFAKFRTLNVDAKDLPLYIGYPHNYEPHAIAKMASEDLQKYLLINGDELHDFENKIRCNDSGGKMFGVLVVVNKNGQLGYLSAFSGKLGGRSKVDRFVPPIFDLLDKESYFLEEEARITLLNKEREELLASEEYQKIAQDLMGLHIESERDLLLVKEEMKQQKLIREKLRESCLEQTELEKLNQKSALEKIEYRKRKQKWGARIEIIEQRLSKYDDKLRSLEDQRKELSKSLQRRIFESYVLINAEGERRNMFDVFQDVRRQWPPAAAGECAAPKLFQFAFENDYKPIALAEFWWGTSPDKMIRKHKTYYTACTTKCEPILKFMLKGLRVDINPLSVQKPLPEIAVLLEDEYLVVINKPAGLLSIPGKSGALSVMDWIKKCYPELTEMMPVHRLDMATSGILLIAKNQNVYKQLQRQFLNKQVEKEYVAILDGIVNQKNGEVELPLRPDLDDRPRQMVCFEHGKPSVTKFDVLEVKEGKTRIMFRPITGRTHQLRVHAVHPKGLNAPIEGDGLYGEQNNRLKLHATKIRLIHPITKLEIKVVCKPPF